MLWRLINWIRSVLVIGFLLVFTGLFAFALIAHLTDPDRQIHRFEALHYDVVLEADGTADVVETRTYAFERGRFSYGWFELAPEATDIRVFEGETPYQRLDAFSADRPPGHFAALPQDGQIRIEYYYLADSPQRRSFQIGYKVPEAAIAYEDSVVYFQKYVSEANTTAIDRVSVLVQLPQGADRTNTLIWAHGPANGTVAFQGRKAVALEVPRLKGGAYVEGRFLLPAQVLPQAQTRAGKRAEVVIEEETRAARDDAQKALRVRLSLLASVVVLAALLLVQLVLFIRHWRGTRRLKPAQAPAYLRQAPSDRSLPLVAFLHRFYHKRPKTPELVSLTLLDLVRRRILRLQRRQENGKAVDWIHLDPQALAAASTNGCEKALLDYLFQDLTDGQAALSLPQLKKRSQLLRNRGKTENLMTRFDTAFHRLWQASRLEDEARSLVPTGALWLRWMGIVSTLGGFLLFMARQVGPYSATGLVLLAGGALLFTLNLICFAKRPLLTQAGEDELALWQALACFFKDLSAFDEKELPEIPLWADLLVVATALSAADRVLKQLKLRYPDVNHPLWQHYYVYWTGQPLSGVGRPVTTALPSFQRAVQQIMTQAHGSVTRASGGGGGGFSSGGSSGGGGAGGSTGGGVG